MESSVGRDISSFLTAKQGVEGDKITQRKEFYIWEECGSIDVMEKNSAKTLLDLLERGHVLDYIDQHSRNEAQKSSKGGPSRVMGVVTWATLFRSVVGYISKETEAIQKLEEKGGASSAIAQANRVSKKKDIAEMLKAYIRACNKRSGSLPLSEVLNHMRDMMEGRQSKNWVAMSYTHIFLIDILQVSQHTLAFSQARWEELVGIYCNMYFSSIGSLDKPLVARTLRTLLTVSTPQVDLPVHGLYIFYSQAFSNISEEKDWKLVEELLGGLCAFFKICGANGRSRLCHLGEGIWSSVLHLWPRVPVLKDQIIDFMRIQVRVHHPGGRVREDEGAWCRNDSVWKGNLEMLYQQILTEYESGSSRLRRGSGWNLSDGAVGQSFEFLDLSCDVVYIRMSSMKDLGATGLGSPKAKRAKTQSCWAVLRDGLSSSKDVPTTISWLQLIALLLNKWKDCLPAREHPPLLSLLQKMLRESESKRVECTQWVLLCLCALASNPTSAGLSEDVGAKELWMKIWHSTIKLLTVHCAEKEGYCLLQTLLLGKWVEPDLGQWQLYNAAFNHPTDSNLRFLAGLLAGDPLPESVGMLALPMATPYSHTPSGAMEAAAASSYPLRTQLLNFLLPPLVLEVNRSAPVGGASAPHSLGQLSARTLVDSNPPPVVLLSHVLVGLTQRSQGSAQLPFLKQLYHPDVAVLFHDLLEPGSGAKMAPPPLPPGLNNSNNTTPSHRADFMSEWADVERILLQSTFDEPLSVPWLDSPRGGGEELSFTRETTIASLQGLLLQLLGRRSKALLQPIDAEAQILASSRERSQQLDSVLLAVAYHSCLVLHTVLLLCTCEAFTHLDQLRKTPAVKTLPQLLQRLETFLRDTSWNDVERSYYHKTNERVLSMLLSLVAFPQDHKPHPPHAQKAVSVVRKLCALSIPDSLMELILELAEGKWPVSTPGLSAGSTFSLAGSSSSTLHTRTVESRSVSVDFDDEEDMYAPDSNPSCHSDFSANAMCAGSHDLLSVSSLNVKCRCQLQAARFLCQAYISMLREEGVAGGISAGNEGEQRSKFDLQKAVLCLLRDRDKYKPVNLQISAGLIRWLCEANLPLPRDVLEATVQVISDILSVHRKNQTVYAECLVLLKMLLCKFTNADLGLTEVRESYITVVSGYWTLCSELPVSVRMKLVDLLTSIYAADSAAAWSNLKQRRKKRSTGQSDPKDLNMSVRQALIKMVNDSDHVLRMHVARAVTTLYFTARGGIHTSRITNKVSEIRSCDRMVLLSCAGQEETFQDIYEVLQLAFTISPDLDDLSAEDESVNRFASRIYTLMMCGCVSPVCERKVVRELVMAVHNIENDLVTKALKQLAVYLGYQSPRQLLETSLLSLVQCWMAEGWHLVDFPCGLMGLESPTQFFQSYLSQLVPHLVFASDEATLAGVSEMLERPLPALLKASLPSTMVLILTCWAQDSEAGEEQRQQATASHDLLCKYMSEEVVGQTLRLSIDVFVIELLVRIFEPHGSNTRLAQFCLTSDPEPCPPHYSSHVIRATFDYMPTCYGSAGAGQSFLRLLSKRHDHIQYILLSLAGKIEATHRSFEKRRLLLAYNLFVQMLCKELEEGGLQGVKSFIIMDVIHTLVRILSEDAMGSSALLVMELFPLCADILDTLCMAVLRACPQELNPHLHTVVMTLMPFARQIRTTQGKQALTLLSGLLDKVSPEVVARLDPFPDSEPFTRLHQKQSELCQELGEITLAEKIERFLSGGGRCLHSVRAEGLKFLQKSLHEAKFEIPLILNQGSSGPLLRLLRNLVDLCPSSSLQPSVTTSHVARVLGEIGPCDLGCIALPAGKEDSFDVDSMSERSGDPKMRYLVKLLHHLAMLLLDKDITVIQASGECLREVLASKTGSAVLTKLEAYEVDSEALWWCRYLLPFKPQKKKKSTAATGAPLVNPASFCTMVDVPELWVPAGRGVAQQRISHSEWLTKLVITLLSSGGVMDEVLTLVKSVCRVKVALCEQVFPLVIHDILLASEDQFRAVLSRQVRHFFRAVSSMPRPSSPLLPHPQSSRGCDIHPDSIRTMLNMVMYLRTLDKPKQSRNGIAGNPWDNNFWLDLDFLDVARAAQRCSAYFTSLLYIEIWHGAREDHAHSSGSRDLADEEVIVIDGACPSNVLPSEDLSDMQTLLLEAYRHIGEPDSVYGACSTHVAKDTTRLLLYEHEGDWHKSLSTHNLLMEIPGLSSHGQVAESLHHLGLSHVLRMYLCGVRGTEGEGGGGEDLDEYLYEAAWRCTQWEEGSVGVAKGIGTSRKGYHQSLFNCITCLKDGEMNSLQSSLNEARFHVVQSLWSTGLESTYGLYPSLSKLLCLLEIEESSMARAPSPDHSHSLRDLSFLHDWDDRLSHLNSDLQFVEPVLAVRGSVLHHLLQVGLAELDGEGGGGRGESGVRAEERKGVELVYKALSKTLLTHARWAREAANFQVCERVLFSLKQLQQRISSSCISILSLCSSLPRTVKLEEAKLYWERGEKAPAMALLNQLLERFKGAYQTDSDAASLYPSSLSLYGSWLADTRSKSPSEIISEYLEKSVALMNGLAVRDKTALMEAYLTLARYADNQYRRIERHMQSPAFEAKRLLLQKSKLELQRLVSSKASPGDRERARHTRTLQTQSKMDESAMANLLGEKQLFLEKALKNYILCLRTGDVHDLRIFRLCGLWFANSSDDSVNVVMENGVSQLESHKFIPLMYQLAARMSSVSSAFQRVLQEVIYRCTLEHPYHCLYIVLALSNATKDEQFPKSGYVTGGLRSTGASKLSKKSAASSSIDEDKVKAAGAMISKLRQQKSSLVKSVELLCDAYIDVAYYDVSAQKKQRGPIKLPATCPLLRLKGSVVVPTKELAVDRTCAYSDVTRIDRFEAYYQLAGGVNLPKVVTCVGSDGTRRKQLVKGRDDLRQDAVMQQIFVLVNKLLQSDPSTSKRKLCVRTYKVIPLSQRSGVVEWCEGTCPLGQYLVGASGAHSRYRPFDWATMTCRRKMLEAGHSSAGNAKADTYAEIMEKFKPVFHHFFMEHFPTPPQWFERRLAYIRSVAASSIVGYMVGLGDRHVQNILIDTNTAEFIHIDLGVAFEQGKTLPTPERVPFRLTRDVVDGMGVAGVEGVFRRCCEKTMSLMRAHQEELRTIVEVLLHDPLYQWTLSPLKAINLQRRPDHGDDTSNAGDIFETAYTAKGGMNSDLNKMAERVLLRLQEKLEGIEDGVPLSVTGQVNHLIQEATDPENLCVLFPGWQAWI